MTADIYRYTTTVLETSPTGTVTPTGVISPVEVKVINRYGPNVLTVHVEGRLVPLIAWLVDNEGFDPADVASVMDEITFVETREA